MYSNKRFLGRDEEIVYHFPECAGLIPVERLVLFCFSQEGVEFRRVGYFRTERDIYFTGIYSESQSFVAFVEPDIRSVMEAFEDGVCVDPV